MAEKGRRSYFKEDYLNTKEIQEEKQFRKVHKKSDTRQQGGCRQHWPWEKGHCPCV